MSLDKKYCIRVADDYVIECNEEQESVAIFGSREAAQQKVEHLFNGKRRHVKVCIVESVGVCCKCGAPLFPSDIKGYQTQCFRCDEDFYGIEQGVYVK